MKWLPSQVLLLVLGLAWSLAASAINGIQVPMAFCTTQSGHFDTSPPWYGSDGPSPTDWNAAAQLSCIRYAAAHNTCGSGGVCASGVCSVSDTCNLLKPPGLSPLVLPAPSAKATSFIVFHQVNTPSCVAATELPAGTCHCPTNAQMATDGNCYCNDGHVWSGAACVLPTACQNVKDGVCQPAAAVAGKNCPTENCAQRGDTTAGTNPINVGTGMKTEHDVLYRSATAQPLSIELQFVSGSALAPLTDWSGMFGRNRYSPFDRVVRILGSFSGFDHAVAVRPNAQRFEFRKATGPGAWTPDQDVADRLERLTNGSGNPGGWRLTAAGGDEVELYDEASPVATMLSVADRQGRTHKFSYADGTGGIRFASGSPTLGFSYTAPACSPPAGWVYQLHSDGTNAGNPPLGRLLCVTDHWGRKLHFQYDPQGRVRKIADPAGQVYQFHYDGASSGCSPHSFENPACSTGMLTSVVFPDAKVRTYHYNEASQINSGTACPGTTPVAPGRGALPRHMTGLEDENGVMFARWTYECGGRATSSQHAGGANKITINYDTFSGQRTVTDYRVDPNTPNQSRTYTYATAFGTVRNTSLTAPCDYCGGGAAARTYDANGNPASRTDFNGNRTNYVYDLTRNLETSRTEGLTSSGSTTPQTRTISTQWHPTFRLPSGIAEPLRITTFTYDAAGNMLSRSIQPTSDATGAQGFSAAPNGAARTWTYTYNANGFMLTVNGPRLDVADVTTYTYDAQDRVETVTNAAGHTTTISAYNAHGQPLTLVDANGLIITQTYDERLRLKTRTVGGELTSYDYDGVGQLTKVTLPDGSFLEYTYDAAHRLTGMQDNLGNRIAYVLDLMGNRTAEEVRDPANQLAQTRSRVFNNLSRLFQELGAQGQTTEYAYDTQGNVLTVKDPLNRITTNQYDALNRLVQVTSPAPISAVTQYAYNGLDALTQVTDPRSLVTGYTVDGLGNLNVQSSPDTGNTTNTYDIAGNLLTQTDAKSQITTYAYDALNRVTLITFHDGSKQAYAYDTGANAIGRLTSITETNPALQVTSVVAYAYDLHGRVTSETRTVAGVQHVLAYSYDSFGRLTGLTYPSGRTVTYSFDGLGRVSAVTTTKPGEQAQTVVSDVAYHPFGGVKGYTLGNGQTYTRGIDLDGRISSYTLGTQSFAIGYDAASRISFISDVGTPANTNTYGYDNLDRLTSAVLPGTPYAYGYDAVGNRTSRTAGSGTDTYAYSATSNRISSITPSSGPLRSFVFDANGSTTADGNNTYAYDVRGRMVQATSSIGATNYQVNALGQRIRKTNSLGDTVFHYDTQGRLIAESDPGGALKRELIYLGDIPVGVVQ